MKKYFSALLVAAAIQLSMFPAAQAVSLEQKVEVAKQQLAQASQKVNINTASATELQRLPGVGMSKAQAIVAYRNDNGQFSTLDELVKVKGIGDKMLAKLRSSATVK